MRSPSDRRLATLLGAVLFVGAAWPLLFVRVPPYQDLWGHLAMVTIMAHPDRYPEFVATGFFKTNAALHAFCFYAGPVIGLFAAARLFALGVLAAGAFVLPRFVLHFGGRGRMIVASLVAWPMVHNWYVGMGMLNFALSIPCSLVLLVLLDRQRAAPSIGRVAAAAAMGVVTWYAHTFPLLVVGFLVVVHVASRGELRSAWREARALVPPLVPAGLLVLLSVAHHLTSIDAPAGGMREHLQLEPTLWQLYDVWAHWMYGFTPLGASTLLAAAALLVWAVRRWRDAPALLGPWPTAALLAAFVVCPYVAFDWGFLGSRFIPFLWVAALVRVPERVGRPWAAALAAAAVLYWVGNGVDVLRLDRDQREFIAGTSAVPEGARVAFLNFSTRVTSKNTWSLETVTGAYVVARHTNALDVWADSASQPIVRRVPPRRWEDPMRMRAFIESVRTREGFCAARVDQGLDRALCDAAWRAEWASFWREAAPACPYVLMFDPTDDARSQLPAGYALRFHVGRLWIWGRG